MYKIEYLESVNSKHYKGISKDIRLEILNIIQKKLSVDPVSFGKPLRYSLKQHYRLRIGSYRIVYRINITTKIVTVVLIGHRKDIYEM